MTKADPRMRPRDAPAERILTIVTRLLAFHDFVGHQQDLTRIGVIRQIASDLGSLVVGQRARNERSKKFFPNRVLRLGESSLFGGKGPFFSDTPEVHGSDPAVCVP